MSPPNKKGKNLPTVKSLKCSKKQKLFLPITRRTFNKTNNEKVFSLSNIVREGPQNFGRTNTRSEIFPIFVRFVFVQ